jgi:hypothetical protein
VKNLSDQPMVPNQVQSVVILVHGIRTYAPWIATLRARFEKEGIVVEPSNYGRLDLLQFLWGSRRKPIDAVWDTVKEVQMLYPNARISFLAHSFGTYIVAKLLQREFNFRAHRVVFCGSVVNYRFPFNQISERFVPPLINETSARDPWPVLAESSSWGYGSAGTFGFRIPRVRDRWHRGFGHGQYLTDEFCKEFWIPFFQSGEIREGDVVDGAPPIWIRLLALARLKYFLPFLLLLLGIAAFYYKLGPLAEPKSPFDDGMINLGLPPQPNSKCYLVLKGDNTVSPPKSFQVWKCP